MFLEKLFSKSSAHSCVTSTFFPRRANKKFQIIKPLILSFFLLSEPVFSGPTSPVASPGNGSEAGSGPAQPKKIRGIGFGDIFKEGSVKLKTRLSINESEDKKQDKVCSGSYCYFWVSCKNNLTDVASEDIVSYRC